MKNKIKLAVLVTSLFGLGACSVGDRVVRQGADAHLFAGNITVLDGQHVGLLEVTNGNVTLGKNTIYKRVDVTNGNIQIGALSQGGALSVTNGQIEILSNVEVSGDVIITNGTIIISEQSQINGTVETSTGDIIVKPAAQISGDLVFNKPGFISSQFENHTPTLKVGKDVKLKGKIHLYRPIKLELDDSINKELITIHY
ncbi:hypothetical protein HG263_12400 [Pseudoalteromonas sp. JBTF-M23]|uniref:Polymer-forming cytoskeletal protein n=1 Tax=Pseudoalteromonas caenipelagi TaxID=2726988 RepID=A0A849VCD4_9GAMM|nr:hypothetical protein [Pseudoalteromonas caenipelagi]NOU51329.1 hypothetical protein [Pseudoalteromonas caenipelagi]